MLGRPVRFVFGLNVLSKSFVWCICIEGSLFKKVNYLSRVISSIMVCVVGKVLHRAPVKQFD